MSTAEASGAGLERTRLALTGLGLYGVGAAMLGVAYLVTFVQVGDSLAEAAWRAGCNVLAAAVVGLAACAAAWRLAGAPWPLQISAHLLGAGAFSWSWYVLLRLIYAVGDWSRTGEFELSWFPPGVLTWQLLQGLMAYAALTGLTYAFRFARLTPERVQVGGGADSEAREPMQRFLTRRGDRIEPVHVDDIILISGADDYSEVVTPSGRHLVRMPLSAFEQRLQPERFLRVHRSTIINFDRLLSAEPAGGGRLLLHLEGGETVQVSRSGAQRLRERVV
jgi:hypothetical protein